MDIGQDLPVTGVCIVSDPARMPPNYTVIDKTHDKSDDADLWKDGLFGRRVMRYLCVQRQIPANSEDVLVDVTLINERDDPPPGFTVLEMTNDSGEKATKKRLICLRWMIPSMTNDAISELIFIKNTQRKAPVSYTMVGDINNMSLCYKMGKMPALPSDQNTEGQGQGLTYSMPPAAGAGLQYAPAPPPRPAPRGLGVNTTAASGGHTGPVSPATNVNPLSGIQWKMNPRLGLIMELQNLIIPETRAKTMGELENQYQYSFELERSVSKSAAVS